MTPQQQKAAGALEGIRVLELGGLIAGPFAGRLMGDFGADIIKVETPERPDPLRTWGLAEENGHHFFWTVHARNKRCITLDMRRSEGQQMFLDLVEHSDVVTESFRPGTLEKWNVGYDAILTRNPRVVLARVSGYGQTGPYASRPGYASVAEAVSGMRGINGYPDQPPPRMAISLGDSLAGMFAVQGVLAALLSREATGVGQVVDVALTESCLALLESMIPDYDRAGIVRKPSGTRLDGIAPSNLYRSKDDRWVIIAANQDTLFHRLCGVMGEEDLTQDPRFSDHARRGRHQDELDERVARWAGEHSAEEITVLLVAAGVVTGHVNSIAEVLQDPQLQDRGMFVEHFDERISAPVLGPGVVPRLSATPGGVRWAGPPVPGTHNAEVYGELLGLSKRQLARLTTVGVI